MENKELPEIGFKKKKEKKGLLPWLRQSLGLSGPSSLGADPEANIVNIGRSLGSAKATGILGLLSGKVGALVTLGIVAAALGTTLYLKNSPSPSEMAASSIGDTSKATSTPYIPAIERVKQNNASSLEMFKQANKGLSLDEKQPEQPKQEEKATEEPKQEEQPQVPNPMGDMMAKLQGVNSTALSTDIGGGGNKMQIGGFGNKINQGTFGPKVSFTNFSSGFGLPKLDASKNKLLEMKNTLRISVKSQVAKKVGYGKNALSQAMGVKTMQRSGNGTNIESLAGQQNKAWEGQTGGGDAQGGAGIDKSGEPGIMTSPSIDNPPASGGGADYNPTSMPEDTGKTVDNPWGNMLGTLMLLLTLSASLAFIGGQLIEIGKYGTPVTTWKYVLGMILVGIALVLAMMAMVLSIKLMSNYGQGLLGGVYLLASLAAIIAALFALNGYYHQAALGWVGLIAAGSGLLMLIAAMAIGPSAEKNYMKDKEEKQQQCIKDGGKWDDGANHGKGECNK